MASSKPLVLVIDDEPAIREVLSLALADEGYEVISVANGEQGLQELTASKPAVVFLDIWMPGGIDGLEFLRRVQALGADQRGNSEFVVMSGHGTIETAVRAVKMGAWDFVEKPLSIDRILILTQNILHYQSERVEKESLLSRLRQSVALIGDSPSMVELKSSIARVASSTAPLLIIGEPGSGRHLVAQNIHFFSPGASLPLVEVQLASYPDELQVYELFGYEAGATDGIEEGRPGRFDLAGHGAIVLEDIADLTTESQSRLVDWLKNSARSQRARLIALTKQDLKEKSESGAFSMELYQLLAKESLQVLPLRKRPIDVPALVSHFSDMFARAGGFRKKRFSDGAIESMLSHHWSGNVRELRNFIERVYILTPGDFVDVHDLRFAGLSNLSEDSMVYSLQSNSSELRVDSESSSLRDPTGGSDELMTNFREARARFEREYLVRKISEYKGNVSRTAEAIGLERSYLHRKIKAYGIDIEERTS